MAKLPCCAETTYRSKAALRLKVRTTYAKPKVLSKSSVYTRSPVSREAMSFTFNTTI